MQGILYGIGTGPGDPELLTLKAVAAIEKCSVIVVPDSGSGDRAAYTTAEKYLSGKELLTCKFAMEYDMEKRMASRLDVADKITAYLCQGIDVGFITLGDPATYSTYMYVHKIVTAQGYKAQIIPGITSYAAAAAELGIALCEGSEPLLIIPAGSVNGMDDLLAVPANKVIMKSGKSLDDVLQRLKQLGYDESTKIAGRVAMGGQCLYNSITEYEAAPFLGYFTVAIVKD